MGRPEPSTEHVLRPLILANDRDASDMGFPEIDDLSEHELYLTLAITFQSVYCQVCARIVRLTPDERDAMTEIAESLSKKVEQFEVRPLNCDVFNTWLDWLVPLADDLMKRQLG